MIRESVKFRVKRSSKYLFFTLNMSLSQNKSKKRQKNLRNVLVNSFKPFWPVISESDSFKINSMLKSCLSPVKINVPRAPWKLLRSLSREERRTKNKELFSQQSPEVIEAYSKALKLRKFLFLGVNELCKGIEEKQVASCVLDAEVSPRILVGHVAELAKNANVPVLAICKLKETVNSVLGFSSLTLGFQKSVEEDCSNIFYEVCLCIIEMAKLVTIPETPLVEFKQIEDNVEKKNIVEENIMQKKIEIENKVFEITPPVKNTTNYLNMTETLENIYLYRNLENVRIFRPLSSDHIKSPINIVNEDCIQLNLEKKEEIFDRVDNKKQRYFLPLVVNRVRGNPNKKKKSKMPKKVAK